MHSGSFVLWSGELYNGCCDQLLCLEQRKGNKNSGCHRKEMPKLVSSPKLTETAYRSTVLLSVSWMVFSSIHIQLYKQNQRRITEGKSLTVSPPKVDFLLFLFFCFITLFIYSHIISFNMVDVIVIQAQEFSRMSLHWVCLMFFSTFI